MKKILALIVVTVALASCNSKIDESQASGVSPTGAAVDKLETLSNADTTAVKDTAK
jgi:hypothetical protein